jgi:hypothetical protein
VPRLLRPGGLYTVDTFIAGATAVHDAQATDPPDRDGTIRTPVT